MKKLPPNTICVGRPSIYGNPIIVGKLCYMCNCVHQEPGDTIPCFKKYAEVRFEWDVIYREAVRALKGKILWCPGCGVNSKTCHARVLEELSIR